MGDFFVSDIPIGGIVGTTSRVCACLGRHTRPVPGLCGGSPFRAFAHPAVMHGSDLTLCRVALTPSAVDGGAVLSKLPLWPAQGRALGALVEVLDHWRLCVVLCAIALPQLHLRGA